MKLTPRGEFVLGSLLMLCAWLVALAVSFAISPA